MKPSGFAILAIAAALPTLASPSYAGAPYQTEDPLPPEPGQWEIYSFVQVEGFNQAIRAAAGFELNYGAAKNLQITIGVPMGFENTRTTKARTGFADVPVGVKYVFVREVGGGKTINVALHPTITLPTGQRNFTSHELTAFLPLSAQKDIGPWSVFGSGGYTVNPGARNEDFWSGGIGVTRAVTPRLRLGAESYLKTKAEAAGKPVIGAGLGLEYELSPRWALLATGGPILAHRRENGTYHFYLALAFAS